ncbi:hypothetical protein Sjap_020362 [Stephania japonica]|uniref:Uncharacterized protein n=1 Tax=Stephania japonica TaxID=461633 RepID=A0AAP0HVI4_9MAGN
MDMWLNKAQSLSSITFLFINPTSLRNISLNFPFLLAKIQLILQPPHLCLLVQYIQLNFVLDIVVSLVLNYKQAMAKQILTNGVGEILKLITTKAIDEIKLVKGMKQRWKS